MSTKITFCLILAFAMFCNMKDIHAQGYCKTFLDSAERAFKRNPELALALLDSVEICDYQNVLIAERQDLQRRIFNEISKLKKRAEKNYKIAQRLISYFQFGNQKAAWAYKDGYFGVIDKKGNKLTIYIYEYPDTFANGFALAKVNNKYVFVNDIGNEITLRYDYVIKTEIDYLYKIPGQFLYVSPQDMHINIYDDVKKTHIGVLVFSEKGLWGVLDSSMNAIVSPKYSSLQRLNQYMLWGGQPGGSYESIDRQGLVQAIKAPNYSAPNTSRDSSLMEKVTKVLQSNLPDFQNLYQFFEGVAEFSVENKNLGDTYYGLVYSPDIGFVQKENDKK